MKKAVFLLLVLVLCIGLWACAPEGGSQQTEGTGASDYTVGTNITEHALVSELAGLWYAVDHTGTASVPVVVLFEASGTCLVDFAGQEGALSTCYVWWIDLDQAQTDDYLYVCVSDRSRTVFHFTIKLMEDQSFFVNLEPVDEEGHLGALIEFKKSDG